MEKNLLLFNQNIEEIGSKDIVKYEDDKGNYMLLPISNLFVNVAYEELTDLEYQSAIFGQKINKNVKLNKKKATRTIDKSTITNKSKDKGILVDKEVEVYQAWTLVNGLGVRKTYNNKEEALKDAKNINEKYLKISKLLDK